MMNQRASSSGFTLIELSIVLVIIGLVVGGILVGRDLIAAAELRAGVSQLEKYKTATNTFRMKYAYLPGDIPSNVATSLGFFAVTNGVLGSPGTGDGNGAIQTASLNWSGEQIAYWRHLSDAQMIDGLFATNGNAAINTTTMIYNGALANQQDIRDAVPESKFGRGNFITILMNLGGSANNRNRFFIYGYQSMTNWFLGPTGTVAITPVEAQQVDVKMDDGLPGTGKTIGGGTANCISASHYNVGSSFGETPQCYLMIDF